VNRTDERQGIFPLSHVLSPQHEPQDRLEPCSTSPQPERDLLVQISEMHSYHYPALVRLNRLSAEFTTSPGLLESPEHLRKWQAGLLEGLIVRVSCNSRELGLVGAMLFARSANALHVESLMLDPRAQGLHVERQMLALLGAIATCRSLHRLAVHYHTDGRNGAMQQFLESLSGEFAAHSADCGTYHFPAEQISRLVSHAADTTPCGFVARPPSVPTNRPR